MQWLCVVYSHLCQTHFASMVGLCKYVSIFVPGGSCQSAALITILNESGNNGRIQYFKVQ